MDLSEYHARLFDKLQKNFQFAPWALGYGKALVHKYGWDPKGIPVQVEPINRLWHLAVERGLEVFIPILGNNHGKWTVLLPGDYEGMLWSKTGSIVKGPSENFRFLNEQIRPNAEYLESRFKQHGIAFQADITPSGAHLLSQAEEGSPGFNALASIGWIEPELWQAYDYQDASDLKRQHKVPLHVGKAFSGWGVLFSYLGLSAKSEDLSPLAVSLSDTIQGVNMDISWTWFPAYMRIMRSSFTGWNKNIDKYGYDWQEGLVTVPKTYFDGVNNIDCTDWEHMTNCLYDKERAIEHAQNFPGYIPLAGEGLVHLINEYKSSELHNFDQDFFHSEMWAKGDALAFARANRAKYSSETRNAFSNPNPNMRTPSVVKRFIEDVLVHGAPAPGDTPGQKLRYIASVLRDSYLEPSYWPGWDRMKEPPAVLAAGMARTIGADVALENDIIKV